MSINLKAPEHHSLIEVRHALALDRDVSDCRRAWLENLLRDVTEYLEERQRAIFRYVVQKEVKLVQSKSPEVKKPRVSRNVYEDIDATVVWIQEDEITL